jgi:SAM-dependent methyltransferase
MRIDLMSKYPKSDREKISEDRLEVTLENRLAAQRFDKLYFDGPRKFGYGGYNYDPKFFTGVVQDFISHFGLRDGDSILDVGCGKGFMLHDFLLANPNFVLRGLDISSYCFDNAMPDIKSVFDVGSCDSLPYDDDSFDVVIAIATIHNLELDGVKNSLREIMRVARRGAFVKVNGYRSQDERDALHAWNLVAKTILSELEWEKTFQEVGYSYDYDFFRP